MRPGCDRAPNSGNEGPVAKWPERRSDVAELLADPAACGPFQARHIGNHFGQWNPARPRRITGDRGHPALRHSTTGSPPGSRKQSAGCSADGTIDWPIPDTCVELSFENVYLPKHHDLDVLFRLGLTHGPNESKDAAGTEVKEREGHIG